MDELRKEYEELIGHKPHHFLWEKKMREQMAEFRERNPLVEMNAPPIDPVTWVDPAKEWEDVWTVNGEVFHNVTKEELAAVPGNVEIVSPKDIVDPRTPEQIEEDIIKEAVGTVPEFIPEPWEVEVSEEDIEKAKKENPENPLMAAMALLLNSSVRTNDLLEKLNKNIEQNNLPFEERVSPPEAIRKLREAEANTPLKTKKIYKVQILRADLTATDWWLDRSESNQIFQTEAEAEEFGKKYGHWQTADGKQRYRVYHESIVLPTPQVDAEWKEIKSPY